MNPIDIGFEQKMIWLGYVVGITFFFHAMSWIAEDFKEMYGMDIHRFKYTRINRKNGRMSGYP
jgi:hypothetical protein